jgi:hypothetical protein
LRKQFFHTLPDEVRRLGEMDVPIAIDFLSERVEPSAGVTGSMDIQDVVRKHRRKWIEANQWQDPNLTDCLDFMATEVAEAIDKRLRMSPNYVRNNVEPKPSPVDIGIEIFDAIMMGCIALDLLDLDLNAIAQIKLEMMDRKKGIV